VLLAACGGGRTSAPAPADTGTGPLTWMLNGSAERMAAYERIAASYAVAHPGKKVEVVAADDPIAKVTALVVAGTPPDVSTVTPVWVGGLAEKGVYQPLEPFLARDRAFRLDDYQPSTIEGGRWKRLVYFLPLFLNLHLLAYNAALFRQRNLPLPSDQWTFDRLRETAVQLTERSGDQTTVFGFDHATDLNNLLPWIWANGGEVFDRNEAPTKSTMATPKVMAALQQLADLRLKQRAVPTASDRAGRTISFQTGGLAMQQQGVSGLSGLVTQAKFEWDLQLLPKGSAPRAAIGGLIQMGIPAGTKLPQSAWHFMSYMIGPAGSQEMLRANQGMTPHKASFQEFVKLGAPPKNRQAVLDAMATVRALPKAAALESKYPEYTRLFGDLFEGKKSVPETCTEIDRMMNAAIVGG
jgi:multiple sugar transport system substrate-binding protein